MTENIKNPTQNSSNEIDLIELIRHLWDSRKLILKITGTFIALGLIVALTSPKQYKVEVRMLPEAKTSMGGASALLSQLGGLGGLAMPMGEGADAIAPMLYPDVLNSTPFFLELLKHKVTYKTKNETLDVTVFEYLNERTNSSLLSIVKNYTIGLPWTIMGRFKGEKEIVENKLEPGKKQLTRITKKQNVIIKELKAKIVTSINQKNGIITITVELSDPNITAQVADFSVNYLSNYITEYRTEKAIANLEFIQKNYKEKETEYLKTQEELAIFRDANRNVQSAEARTGEDRLNNKYTLAFNVFNGLAQQLEQAKIKVQEETPVIKILEPVKVPVERSKPKRLFILTIFTFLGGFLGIGVVFGKKTVINISQQLKSE